MRAEIKVYVCSTAEKAEEARNFLLLEQFVDIAVEQADIFRYDSATYEGGTRHEGPLQGTLVVIGKK